MSTRRLSVLLLLTLAACASTSQGQLPPPMSAETPATSDTLASPAGGRDAAATGTHGDGAAPDRGADADLDAARNLFDRGDQQGARVALEAFVTRHPHHPGRTSAELLLARLALTRGDAAGAKKVLDPLIGSPAPDAGAASAPAENAARYYLGLAEVRLGNHARARTLLLPFAPRNSSDAPQSDDAAVELRGALAEATADSDPLAALELWEGYVRVAREHEKAWARGRAGEIIVRIPPEAAWRAYGAAPPSGLTRAVLGGKAAAYLRSRGDAAGAAFIESEANDARHALGFDLAAPRVGPGDPTRIGLSIPLSGKFQVVGEAVLRAAMLASGTPSETATSVGVGVGAQLVLRDTATDAERAARGVAELTRSEAVIGIVGAASAKTGSSAIAQATQDGIPLLALEDAAPGALTTAFQLVHAPDARAVALARQALKLGVRRFAILGPDSAAGKRLREAFRKAVTDGGGAVVAESSYVAGATSFASVLGPLKKGGAQAIFVPDSAERLPLIAPALAVADLWPQPWSKARAAGSGGGSSSGKQHQ
ncbi:MAG: penicillin-binding protein activator, partial [Myxococcales bacterium]